MSKSFHNVKTSANFEDTETEPVAYCDVHQPIFSKNAKQTQSTAAIEFFGEILEWTGFAIMTWSPAALVFALWSFFNLVPRALDHHKWYKKTFPDYPKERKAILPRLL